MGVFDGHSDLLYDVTRRRLKGETQVLERRHLAKLQEGGVEGLVLAFWYGTGQGQTFWKDVPGSEQDGARLRKMVECAEAEFSESPWLAVVRTAGEAGAAKASGRLYAFLSVEGLSAIGEDLTAIDALAGLGVRLATLTWNEENALASGAAQDPSKGLTALGKQALRRLEDSGILPDVSHLNDGGFRDVLRLANGPVIASHSNCRALCGVPRNLTDEQLRAIRDTGGVVGLNSHHAFVHPDPGRQTLEALAVHAAHMADVLGVDHVACGFDFCHYMGPGNDSARGLEDCGSIPAFFQCLADLGMNAAEREQIARGNFLRLLS